MDAYLMDDPMNKNPFIIEQYPLLLSFMPSISVPIHYEKESNYQLTSGDTYETFRPIIMEAPPLLEEYRAATTITTDNNPFFFTPSASLDTPPHILEGQAKDSLVNRKEHATENRVYQSPRKNEPNKQAIQIEMMNQFGDIHTTGDIDTFINALTRQLQEAVYTSTEGLHF